MPRLLYLITSATTLELGDGTPYPSGYWPEEALVPYDRFVSAGVDLIVATPDGRPPHPDPYGLEWFFHFPDEDEDFLAAVARTFMPDPEDIRITLEHLTEHDLMAARRVVEAYRQAGVAPDDARSRVEAAARTAWAERRNFVAVLVERGPEPLSEASLRREADTLRAQSQANSDAMAARCASLEAFARAVSVAELTDEEIAGFDAVFIPGGQGPMVDMAANPAVRRVLDLLHEKERTIATLCHGPAALLSAGARADGLWLFDGYRMTSFSNDEEYQTRPTKQPPWYVESALKNAGAVFDNAASCWSSHVVVDRNLITGSNPMSSEATADALLKRLERL